MTEHKFFRITGFSIIGLYTLLIEFNDGTEQEIDFEPILYGPVFGPLRDPALFQQVELIDYAGCLEWPTGADFDPETLHDWPTVKDDIIARRQLAFQGQN